MKAQNIQEAVKDMFPSVYLTLTSIIQAAVLGFLFTEVSQVLDRLTASQVMILCTTLASVVAVWNEYMMGSTVMVWLPRLWDSVLPFLLGAAQFLAIIAATHSSSVGPWFGAMAVFSIVVLLGFENMFRNARRHESKDLVDHLGHWPRTTMWTMAVVALIDGGIFAFSVTTGLSRNGALLCSVVSLVVVLVYLSTRVFYWRRVLSSPVGRRHAEDREAQAAPPAVQSEKNQGQPPIR